MNDIVDVSTLGIKASNDAKTNSRLALEAQLALGRGRSQRWLFDGDDYLFDTFDFIRPIWLEGIGGSYSRPATRFLISAGSHGLRFNFASSTVHAQGAAAINLRIEAKSLATTRQTHGIVMNAGGCFLSHLFISGFRGDGVHIVAGLLVPPKGKTLVDVIYFSDEQIAAPLFADKLRNQADEVSKFLFASLPAAIQADLLAKKTVPVAVFTAELQKVLKGPSIYTNTRFASVPLRATTRDFQTNVGSLNPEDLTILNRLLLEDAYPIELSKLEHKHANQFRIESVYAANNGSTLEITSLKRTKRELTIVTKDPHGLEVGDIFWLEPEAEGDPNFPRGICSIEFDFKGKGGALDEKEFRCLHSIDSLTGTHTAVKGYKIILGHGLYTHGGDAGNGLCIAGLFTNNSGWGVLEDSGSGNTYMACNTSTNKLGPYRAANSYGSGTLFAGCYAEGDQRPSEIYHPAVVVSGDQPPGNIGRASWLQNRWLDAATARVVTAVGSSNNTQIGSLRLGSFQETIPFHLEFTHRESDSGPASEEGYRLAYSYDDVSSFPSFSPLLPLYGGGGLPAWKKVYYLGWHNISAAFLLTTRGTVGSKPSIDPDVRPASGRPIPEGKIAFPSGYYTAHGCFYTEALPDPKNPSNFEDVPGNTWEVGDRIFNARPIFNPDPKLQSFERWVCIKSGTSGDYTEGLTIRIVQHEGKIILSSRLSGESSILKRGQWLHLEDLETKKKVFVRIESLLGRNIGFSKTLSGGEYAISFAPPEFKGFDRIA